MKRYRNLSEYSEYNELTRLFKFAQQNNSVM